MQTSTPITSREKTVKLFSETFKLNYETRCNVPVLFIQIIFEIIDSFILDGYLSSRIPMLLAQTCETYAENLNKEPSIYFSFYSKFHV